MLKNATKTLARASTRLPSSLGALIVYNPHQYLRLLPPALHAAHLWPTSNVRSFSSQAEHIEKVPQLGDSVKEATVVQLLKNVGDYVKEDEVYCVLETDKVSVDIRATKSGKITSLAIKQGATIEVGGELARLDTSAKGPSGEAKASKGDEGKPSKDAGKGDKDAGKGDKDADSSKSEKAAEKKSSSKDDEPKAQPKAEPKAENKLDAPRPAKSASPPAPSKPTGITRQERRVPATRMRLTIASRMKDSQNTAASLTTFNEIDMSNLMQLRDKVKDEFAEVHGVKLGFMSAFVKASSAALQKFPDVNGYLDGKEIVYRDFVDISVAVATPTGLVVPVLRNCEHMSFRDVELTINHLGEKARKGQIAIEDMVGGTFTISNGGVFGSLMGTPIINVPQSAILGMHGIFKRPIAVGDKVEIRPMMYVALTYDHRMIDGSTAVRFLRTIKANIEEPSRLLLGL